MISLIKIIVVNIIIIECAGEKEQGSYDINVGLASSDRRSSNLSTPLFDDFIPCIMKIFLTILLVPLKTIWNYVSFDHIYAHLNVLTELYTVTHKYPLSSTTISTVNKQN